MASEDKGKKSVPVEKWMPVPVSDAAEYLDGPMPGVMSPEEEKNFEEYKKSKGFGPKK